jgi:hypothetical protein
LKTESKNVKAVIPGTNAERVVREVHNQRHPEARAIFGAPRRMVFSAVLAAILRGSQELAPQDDGRDGFTSSQDDVVLGSRKSPWLPSCRLTRERDLAHGSPAAVSLGSSSCVLLSRHRPRRSKAMTGADKVVCQAATLLLLLTLTSAPAKAQFQGGGGGGGDMMTQMAPMLEMMKAKMGKRRFGMMMQTMGPMMGQMMEGGGGMGGMGGGIPGGLGGMLGGGGVASGGEGYIPQGLGMGGGGDIMGMLGGGGGGELMGMIPQLMRMANFGGGGHHRRHRRR